MAKGAKRKTKWVSLSLDGANTTTSSGAPGSDGEQPLHHVHRHKAHHGSSNIQQKQNERKDPAVEPATEHSSSIKATEQDHQNGNRTDTSGSGSDSAVAGSERRYPTSYHKRRPPPYNAERRTNSSWSGGGGGGSNRSHYGGYYGAGRRSYYGEGRRGHQSVVGTTGSKTTTTSDSGGAPNTINDDEYTRITTPRQDVLFKKGYLSRPKPQTTTTTTTTTAMTADTTASSSLAGTTSEGSDGGNGGGSNSISTTESITSDYGGSFAADSFPIPCLPYGYFTENGVLVMNGFAVDNNGYSYFNGGQTYIYPPNFTNCQAPNSAEATVPEEAGLACSTGETLYDGTVAEEQGVDAQPAVYGEDGTTECTAASANAVMPDSSTMHPIEEGTSDQPEPSVVDGFLVSQPGTGATINDDGSFEGSDLEANGFYQFNDSYDMAQFYSSVCYPQWCMGHYGLCEDGTPLQATEYVMPNGEVYTHQTSFKKRKKRFRHQDEVQQDESGTAVESVATPVPLMFTSVPVQGGFVPSSTTTTTVPVQLNHQLNADVEEFLPSVVTPAATTTDATERTTSHRSARKSNTQPTAAKKSLSTVSSASKNPASAKAAATSTPVESVATPSAAKTAPIALRPPALGSHKNRKKDLIESTLAFAEQNIDLTRPKLAASQSHDIHDLLWTTVSKGGRKRVVEQEQPVDTVPITGCSDRPVDEAKPVIDSQQSIKQPAPVATGSSEPRPLATVVHTPEAESKKEVTGKNKKKTQKHKRQQRKPGNAVLHRQPLEGFQLIEPEFTPRVDLAPQRGVKGCDSEVLEHGEEVIDPVDCDEVVEEVLAIEEARGEDEPVVSPPLVEENKVVVCITEKEEEEEEEAEEKEEVPHDELICDRIVEQVDSAPIVRCNVVVECPEPAEPVPESQIVVERALIDDEIILNETETEKQVMLEVATMANMAEESECNEPAVESKTVECPSIVAVDGKECSITTIPEELNQPSVEPPPSPVEERPQVIECIAIKPLLTLAAEPERVPDERTPRMSDTDEADEEEMGEDRHRKRDSVSGYTESIDSGLQSPAPCGQATPETSSLASSHEAEPHEDEHRGPQLSQLVGLWLTRKLEDHEPDEVFVLPHSNPLLMQRLHQFQQLQCGRDRLASDSYDDGDDDDDDDADDDDDERDTDSDYMSDGQGRHDGSVATNPSSPVINHVSEDRTTVLPEQAQEQHQSQNGTKSQNLHLKQSAAVLNGSTKTTASSTISEQTQQKRCVIM
ncbi:uncharacterized protein LOC126574313 [Anopheles aquasalis]|uniref:uncharacterized protein LOC126574313 n=1 Tax=Anopheles aquasalis TaxID=42839 RepID=UPI00215A6339|nr:uncharacterized protein LOC126574313 [Anopheles aquasalis]XP_050090400.1 uncharacterized protein LOC126574313 [Anopheles aquasalis]XP_050090401.1 uncharacterized protein LOC126574313 [Anopheles aquasalis]XP_050090402.1 uncharacterized protein LOC126574313 [Anopheles aquasalis]